MRTCVHLHPILLPALCDAKRKLEPILREEKAKHWRVTTEGVDDIEVKGGCGCRGKADVHPRIAASEDVRRAEAALLLHWLEKFAPWIA